MSTKRDPTILDRASTAVSRLAAALRRPFADGGSEASGDEVDAAMPGRVADAPATDGGSAMTDGGESTGYRTRSELSAETGLQPETYVERLLEENDGRLRQSDIGEQAKLSASTTSRLLSDMEAAGHVVRIPDGREKVVCLPTHVPEFAAVDATA